MEAIRADPDALVYFLLNVGDGDTQLLLLLPPDNHQIRRLMVVDVATPGKNLEDSPWIRRLQPTAGTTLYLRQVRVTVLGPSVALRTRFDAYGVGINDASITLMVEYPATAIYAEPDPQNPDRKNRRQVRERSWRLLLGADAQFASWAQTISDFPDLKDQYNPQLAAELRTAIGPDYLHADVLKVSHHASKHGVNIEFLATTSSACT